MKAGRRNSNCSLSEEKLKHGLPFPDDLWFTSQNVSLQWIEPVNTNSLFLRPWLTQVWSNTTWQLNHFTKTALSLSHSLSSTFCQRCWSFSKQNKVLCFWVLSVHTPPKRLDHLKYLYSEEAQFTILYHKAADDLAFNDVVASWRPRLSCVCLDGVCNMHMNCRGSIYRTQIWTI